MLVFFSPLKISFIKLWDLVIKATE
jgi:hypothetical protein